MRDRRIVSMMTGLLLLGLPGLASAQTGESGMAFLKLGVSGRGVAMGDAMSAIVSGAPATYFNPAGLVSTSGAGSSTELMFMHKEWIQDTRTEFLGAAIPLGEDQSIGAAVTTTTVSDIEIRTKPGPADGSFTSRDLSAGFSYARSITPEIRVGLTAKFLYEKIFLDEASGFAVDIGGMWQTPIENLVVGAAVANLGSMNALKDEKPTLPALVRLGPGYHISLSDGQLELVGAADFLRIFPEKKNYLNTGIEGTFNRTFSARLGYQFGSEGRGFCAGIGIRYGMFAVDYGFTRLAADLGNGHTFSLGLSL